MALGTTNNNSATATQELTAEQVQRILVQPLEQKSVFLASGPRIFDTDGSPVRIPKQATATVPGWVGENEAVAEVNPNFDELTLLPQGMKSVATLVRFSNQLLRQSIVSLDTALQSRLVTDVAAQIDTALIGSTTTDGTKPTGLLSYAGVQSVSAIGDVNLDDLQDAYGLALGANVDVTNLRWFMRPETFMVLRKTKAGTDLNSYVLQPDATSDGVFRILGAPVVITSRIPKTGSTGTKKTQIALADMSQVAVARDTAPRVAIDSSRFFEFRQTAILVEARYDAAPLNAQAIVRLDGVNVTD